MTMAFGDFDKTSLNGAVGIEIWLEEAEENKRGNGATDFKSLQFLVRGCREMDLWVNCCGERVSFFFSFFKLNGRY